MSVKVLWIRQLLCMRNAVIVGYLRIFRDNTI